MRRPHKQRESRTKCRSFSSQAIDDSGFPEARPEFMGFELMITSRCVRNSGRKSQPRFRRSGDPNHFARIGAFVTAFMGPHGPEAVFAQRGHIRSSPLVRRIRAPAQSTKTICAPCISADQPVAALADCAYALVVDVLKEGVLLGAIDLPECEPASNF
jgi:hypothetical protein